MKLATIKSEGKIGIAATDDVEFKYLLPGEAAFPGNLDELLAAGADLEAAARIVLSGAPLRSDAVFLPPVRRPGKIICIGLNYVDHAQELNLELPDYPTVFNRFATSLIGHGLGIMKPSCSDQLDFEAELAFVLGRSGRNISKADALSYVAGYSCFNDATLRDYQFRTTQWTIGKNFDQTGAFGPALTLSGSLPAGARGLDIVARLNGEVVQSSNTDALIFDVPTLVSLLSEVMTLEAGDVVITGTPAGVGASRDPKLFMKPGDIFEVEVSQIGTLRNSVVA